jgi:predicted membrane protein
MDTNKSWREMRREERRKRREEWMGKWEQRRSESMQGDRGHGHVWTGLFIILIGVAALLKASLTDIPDWVFSWQTFLIALGFFVGFRHGFRGGAWLVLILIGGAFLVRDIYPDLPVRRYIWPAILIVVGIFLILRPRRRNYCFPEADQKKNDLNTAVTEAQIVEEPYTGQRDYQEDFVDSTSVFGGAKKNIISKNFKGGDLVNIFGGTELDLSRADFTGTAEIELTTIFGGTKLIIPSNWTLQSEVVTVFGGLEDKRSLHNMIENPDKILKLKGTVILGGIEIKSF